jgi:hypothetical protein
MRPLLPMLLLAACAAGPAGEADLTTELAGRTAGPPQDCVAASPGESLVARDSRTLVYRRGATLWVDRLAAACPGLDPMSTLIVDVQGSQYCRGDRVRALDPGQSIPGPPCLLGPFTPWSR